MINTNKKTLLLINLISFQTFLMIFALLWQYWGRFYYHKIPDTVILKIIFVAAIILTITALYLFREVLRLTQKEKQAGVTEVQLRENKELVDVLRTQRHDFLNHLQVISGLVQLKKYDQVRDYISDINGEMGYATRISNIQRPEIAALLMKKLSQAHKAGIDMEYDVNTQFTNLKVSQTDIIGIFANLLDNAIQAVDKLSNKERSVYFGLLENKEYYIFEVNNPGPPIPEQTQKTIFEKGSTSKKEDGHGYGLYIVKTLVEKNKGYIKLISNEEMGTTFEVGFPKVEN